MGGFVRVLLLAGFGWLVSSWAKKPDPPPSAPKTFFEWNDERRFDWYMAKRTGYSNGARDSYSRYDQTIASVSAGTIVLSITFLKDIGYTAWSIPWLYASWIAFLFAGGFSLYSLRTSADSDIERLAELESLCRGRKHDDKKGQELGQRTVRLNDRSLRCFVAGIVFAMVFAFINYPVLGGQKWRSTGKQEEKAIPAKVYVEVVSPTKSPETTPKLPAVTPSATTRPESTSPKVIPANRSPRQ